MSHPTLAELAADTAEADSVRFAAERTLGELIRSQEDPHRTKLALRAVAGVRQQDVFRDLIRVTEKMATEAAEASARALSVAGYGDVSLQRQLLHLVRRMERVVSRNRAEVALTELDAARRALLAPPGAQDVTTA